MREPYQRKEAPACSPEELNLEPGVFDNYGATCRMLGKATVVNDEEKALNLEFRIVEI